jgi:hypothetical protein
MTIRLFILYVLMRQKYKINISSNLMDCKNHINLTNFINNVEFYACFMHINTFPVRFDQ